jgi:hypothetical protein
MSGKEKLLNIVYATRNIKIPFYLVVAIIVATSLLTATMAQGPSIILTKPARTPIATASSNLVASSASFSYDAYTNKWTFVTIQITNEGGEAASGTVTVILYDSQGNPIASGSASTGTVSAGSATTVLVTLSWSAGVDADDVVSGTITVNQG